MNKKYLEKNSQRTRKICWAEKDEIHAFDDQGNLIKRIQENMNEGRLLFDGRQKTSRANSEWNLELRDNSEAQANVNKTLTSIAKAVGDAFKGLPERPLKLNQSFELKRQSGSEASREASLEKQRNCGEGREGKGRVDGAGKLEDQGVDWAEDSRAPIIRVKNEDEGSDLADEGKQKKTSNGSVKRVKESPKLEDCKIEENIVSRDTQNGRKWEGFDELLGRASRLEIARDKENKKEAVGADYLDRVIIQKRLEEISHVLFLKEKVRLKKEELKTDYVNRFVQAKKYF